MLTTLFLSATLQAAELDPSILASTSAVTQVAIQKRADFLTVSITLTSTKDSTDNRIRDLQRAKKDLGKKAEDDNQVSILSGHILQSDGISANTPKLDLSTTYTIDAKGNEIKDGAPSTITLYATIPLEEDEDLLPQAEVLGEFVDRLLFGSVKATVGVVELGIHNPEQYRAELLKKIMTDISEVRKICEDQAVVNISGLDRRIRARVVDATHIDLFIPYTMSLELYDPKGLLPKTVGRASSEK